MCLQDLSFVYVASNDTEFPKATGLYIYLEFKDSYDYCLVPSYSTDQGRLMSYPGRPSLVDMFKHTFDISKVDIFLWLKSLHFIFSVGRYKEGNNKGHNEQE